MEIRYEKNSSNKQQTNTNNIKNNINSNKIDTNEANNMEIQTQGDNQKQNNQKRINEFFKVLEKELLSNSEEENTSTQRMIEDARIRRQNKNENFNCDNCNFKATSMTNLTNHKKNAHQRSIRKRYKCNECDYICTSEAYLKHHTEKIHKQNSHQCEKNSTQKTIMNQHNQIQNPSLK